MSRTDDRTDVALPVTAEVGAEGGSYADPVHQVATFRGDAPRADAPLLEPHPETDTDVADTMRRYPTERPQAAAAAKPGGRNRAKRWQAGLLGAAAGAAVMYGVLKRRH